tara:strand:- start:3766 stop:4482 length:717 start_codon:yes stop_codon:yes gene_type:complete
MKFGIFIKCPQIEIIEVCGIAKIDFVVLDMEHTPLGFNDLKPLLLAAEKHSLEIILRLPANKEEYFKWPLDIGFEHIQVPQIETEEDAHFSIKNTFFYPKGERGLCRFVRAANYSDKDKNAYIKDSNESLKLTLQIEGKKGIDNLDSILSTPNLESIMIGPYDLSQSLGMPGDIWNEEVINEMSEIIKKCKKLNIQVGTFTDTIDGINFWKDRGVDFIEYASDLNLLLDSIKNLKKGL